MEIITLNSNNIDEENICCSMSSKKGEVGAINKKNWLRERFNEGLVFKKGNVNGKVFIEYISSENAWAPIDAPNYIYINCLWVSGKYKGNGYSNLLLDECIYDAKNKGKEGLVILSSKKKRSYIADRKYLLHKGFTVCDETALGYELMYMPFNNTSNLPRFKECAKIGGLENSEGIVIYYSNQCPFTEDYINKILDYTRENNINININIKKYNNASEAQKSTVPYTSYAIFKDGKFIGHEVLTVKKFVELL